MLGNKYGADEIAKEFLKLLKTSQDEGLGGEGSPGLAQPEPEVNAADFLVSSVSDVDGNPSTFLDQKISEVDSYANDAKDDDKCDCGCEGCECNKNDCSCACDEEVDNAEDFILNSSAKEVLHGLGKIAKGLRDKGENFAADMVEVTALDISKDLATEASKKLFVIDELKKVEASFSDDGFAADMVKAAINKIKRS